MVNWIQQTTPTQQPLNHVFGFGPFNVYAVGNLGTIVRWDGSKWTLQASGVAQNLNRIWGASSASVWVVGAGGAMLNSTNNGQTWNPVNTLNTFIGGNGNYVGIWGQSALDFWVIENSGNSTFLAGSFYHTTDGGNTWSQFQAAPVGATAPPASWNHLWGQAATGSVPQYLIAIGTTGAPAVGAMAWNGGSGWTSTAEATGSVDGQGGWPYGPTTQIFTVGRSATGFTGSSVRDWTYGFTGSVFDKIPSGQIGDRLNFVYGSDLTNLYAVGAGGPSGVSGALLLQIAPPPGSPSVTGSWNAVQLPVLSPTGAGGLLAVYADSSGYATAVGNQGVVVARPGNTALGILNAVAVATNTVQVTLATAPLAKSPVGLGDALNASSWLVTRIDTNQSFNVMTVTLVSPTVFNLVLYLRLANALVTHQVAAPGLLDAFGNSISGATTTTFAGVVADKKTTSSAIAAAQKYTLSDIANPPIPATGNQGGGGTRAITQAGDFATESGTRLLKKLILRRLSTAQGGFFHLPGYGIGIRVKEKLSNADLAALKKTVQDQVSLEPEVLAVQVGVQQNNVTGEVDVTLVVQTTQGPIEMNL